MKPIGNQKGFLSFRDLKAYEYIKGKKQNIEVKQAVIADGSN